MTTQLDPFELRFDLRPLEALDRLALLARQDYNLGDHGRWFTCFRKGKSGFYSRLGAVYRHYFELHAWQIRCPNSQDPEYHLASIFFGLDSALECCLYSMNALGYGAFPADFVDITTEKGLRQLGPWIMFGTKDRKPLAGIERHFPESTRHWRAHADLIAEIQRQHDVSKHRSTTYVGGMLRKDPPPEFLEALGIAADDRRLFDFAPMAEVILDPDPKRPPSAARLKVKHEDLNTLEALCTQFKSFIGEVCVAWLTDARAMLPLRHIQFLERNLVVGRSGIILYSDPACTVPIPGVQGVRIDTIEGPYPQRPGGVVPASDQIDYPEGASLPLKGKNDTSRVIGKAWYREGPSDEVQQARWSSASLYTALPEADY